MGSLLDGQVSLNPVVTLYSPESRTGMQSTLDDVLDLFVNYTHVKRLPAEQAYKIADAHLIGALWAVGTWFVTDCQAYPYLMITAPEKNSGKSTAQQLLFHVVKDPLKTSNLTAAAVYHSCKDKPTMLIDEVDTFIAGDPALIGVLNSGYTADGTVARVNSKKRKLETFSTYCAKSLSGIKAGDVSDTLESRSLVMTMERKPEHVKLRDLDNLDENPAHAQQLLSANAKIAAAYNDYQHAFSELKLDLPDWLQNRNRQLWKPLLKLAYLGGDEWYSSTLRAAKNHCDKQKKADAEDNLLADIRDVFDINPEAGFIRSVDLIKHLCADSLKKWATYNKGKSIIEKQVANLLKPHGIEPRRNKEQTARGYFRSDFEDSWASYAPREFAVYPSINGVEQATMRVVW